VYLRTPSPVKQRYLFIDLLRFCAVVLMIQGHVFDAVLSSAVKSLPKYYLHDFFHGFVAPAFLFSSGVAFGISTMKRWERYIAWGPENYRRFARFSALLAIGYALHLPYFSLRKIITSASAAEMHAFYQVDALQCIAVTLLTLQILVLTMKNVQSFVRAVAIAAVILVFGAPLVWSTHFSERIPVWLVSYLNAQYGSFFPLFPWAAYLLCGVLFGHQFVRAAENGRDESMIQRRIAIHAAVIILAVVISWLPYDIYPAHDFWKTNPAMFAIRWSAVSIVACVLFLMEKWIQLPMQVPLILGRESLFIYILHLLVVYGSVLNRGLSERIGPTLTTIQSLGIVALVLAAIAGVTVLWYEFKSRQRTAALWISAASAAVFLFEFLKRPW
jgi:uncharacterized membrane protein